MTTTLTLQDRILEKFDKFIKDKVNYIVVDKNDPRIGHYAREDIKQFLIYSIKEVREETAKNVVWRLRDYLKDGGWKVKVEGETVIVKKLSLTTKEEEK